MEEARGVSVHTHIEDLLQNIPTRPLMPDATLNTKEMNQQRETAVFSVPEFIFVSDSCV